MCYLVAKWFSENGSIAMRAEAGEELVNMIHRVGDRFGCDDLQLVTLSRPSAYGEYEPYSFVDSEQELVSALQQQVASHAAVV